MRRDSIFFQLFQRFPSLLFDLLEQPPSNAQNYRFDSVAVKEPKFEIDGVFLPPASDPPGVVYFCEVQFQKDERLYERLFAESMMYFYRNRDRFSDWQGVVIYPSRATEQNDTHPYRHFLDHGQVIRVYLDELDAIEQLPLGIALMRLTTVEETDAADVARALLERSRQEASSAIVKRSIMEMVTTIMVYKFTNLERQEIEAMLAQSLQETRFYQEVRAEGEEIGEQRAEQRGIERERALILRLLTRKVGEVPEAIAAQIEHLSLTQLENLGEALLDFANIQDLIHWLEAISETR